MRGNDLRARGGRRSPSSRRPRPEGLAPGRAPRKPARRSAPTRSAGGRRESPPGKVPQRTYTAGRTVAAPRGEERGTDPTPVRAGGSQGTRARPRHLLARLPPAPCSGHRRPEVPATHTSMPGVRRGAPSRLAEEAGTQLSGRAGRGRVRGRPGQPLTSEELGGTRRGAGSGRPDIAKLLSEECQFTPFSNVLGPHSHQHSVLSRIVTFAYGSLLPVSWYILHKNPGEQRSDRFNYHHTVSLSSMG
nr:uncharacterized protein LOC105863356 [Microcebus murinus]